MRRCSLIHYGFRMVLNMLKLPLSPCKIADMGKTLEVAVLCPEYGVVCQCCGVDEAVGKWEFVFDAEICRPDGYFCKCNQLP